MQKDNMFYWLVIGICLISGFLSGWQIKEWTLGKNNSAQGSGPMIRIHDTIKTPVIDYKIIPGTEYNVDSLTGVINQFWKDSLKSLYGKGMFEAKFSKEERGGKQEITLESRIPIDPETRVAIDEEVKLPEVYRKRTIGILGGVEFGINNGLAGIAGIKYYVMDFRNFSIAGIMEGRYVVNNLSWHPAVRIDVEVRF